MNSIISVKECSKRKERMFEKRNIKYKEKFFHFVNKYSQEECEEILSLFKKYLKKRYLVFSFISILTNQQNINKQNFNETPYSAVSSLLWIHNKHNR